MKLKALLPLLFRLTNCSDHAGLGESDESTESSITKSVDYSGSSSNILELRANSKIIDDLPADFLKTQIERGVDTNSNLRLEGYQGEVERSCIELAQADVQALEKTFQAMSLKRNFEVLISNPIFKSLFPRISWKLLTVHHLGELWDEDGWEDEKTPKERLKLLSEAGYLGLSLQLSIIDKKNWNVLEGIEFSTLHGWPSINYRTFAKLLNSVREFQFEILYNLPSPLTAARDSLFELLQNGLSATIADGSGFMRQGWLLLNPTVIFRIIKFGDTQLLKQALAFMGKYARDHITVPHLKFLWLCRMQRFYNMVGRNFLGNANLQHKIRDYQLEFFRNSDDEILKVLLLKFDASLSTAEFKMSNERKVPIPKKVWHKMIAKGKVEETDQHNVLVAGSKRIQMVGPNPHKLVKWCFTLTESSVPYCSLNLKSLNDHYFMKEPPKITESAKGGHDSSAEAGSRMPFKGISFTPAPLGMPETRFLSKVDPISRLMVLEEFFILVEGHEVFELDAVEQDLKTIQAMNINLLKSYVDSYKKFGKSMKREEVVVPISTFQWCSKMLRLNYKQFGDDCASSMRSLLNGEDDLVDFIIEQLKGVPEIEESLFAISATPKHFLNVAKIPDSTTYTGILNARFLHICGFELSSSLQDIDNDIGRFRPKILRFKMPQAYDARGSTRKWTMQLLNHIAHVDFLFGYDGAFIFRWLTHRSIGRYLGLLFGKALQLGVRLPFKLHERFFNLISNPTEQRLDEYFDSIYEINLRELFEKVEGLGDPEKQASIPLVKPENLKFNSFISSENLYGAKDDQAYNLGDLKVQVKGGEAKDELVKKNLILQLYHPLVAKIREEFKEFVKEFLLSFGLFAKVEYFKYFPESYRWDEMLQFKRVTGDNLLKAIRFTRGTDLFGFCNIGISREELFGIFIQVITDKQLDKLLELWTGVATPNIDDGEFGLSVNFISDSGRVPKIEVDFDNAESFFPENYSQLETFGKPKRSMALRRSPQLDRVYFDTHTIAHNEDDNSSHQEPVSSENFTAPNVEDLLNKAVLIDAEALKTIYHGVWNSLQAKYPYIKYPDGWPTAMTIYATQGNYGLHLAVPAENGLMMIASLCAFINRATPISL